MPDLSEKDLMRYLKNCLCRWQTHEDVYNNVLDYSPSDAERLPWELSCEEVSALPLQQLIGRGFWSEVYLTHKDGNELAVKRFAPIEAPGQDPLDRHVTPTANSTKPGVCRDLYGTSRPPLSTQDDGLYNEFPVAKYQE
eukprot:gene3158-4002_t